MKILKVFLGVVAVAAIGFVLSINGLCLEYLIEFWVPLIKEAPVDVPLLPCIIVGLFLGGLPLPLALMTWLFSGII